MNNCLGPNSQKKKDNEMSKRMYERNVPYAPLQMTFSPRPVDTKHVVMPILDCRKPVNEVCDIYPVFNTRLNFTPGQAPFSGYANDIDNESKLKNIVAPLQKAVRSKFIPNSDSDLYNNAYLAQTTRPVEMGERQLLFVQPKLQPFNPNPCGLGYKLFDNCTRQQIKDIGLNK